MLKNIMRLLTDAVDPSGKITAALDKQGAPRKRRAPLGLTAKSL
jgi:hypothetical protein